MAEERRPVVHPIGGSWKLAEAEETLRASARDVPNWRLANASWKMLADLVHQLSRAMPSLGQPSIADLDPRTARQIASVQLAGLSVRSSSAAISLISSGYEPEAGALVRRLVEAVLRIRAVNDDSSGEQARQWLAGRPRGSAERLARRYGNSEDLAILSALSHADMRALLPVAIPPGWNLEDPEDGYFDVRPSRDGQRAQRLLYAVGYETASFAGTLAEVFEVAVQIPRWLSAELIRLRSARTPDVQAS